jgi:hypothetical protein
MANYVSNTMSVYCHSTKADAVRVHLARLLSALEEHHDNIVEVLWDSPDDVDPEFDRRTYFEDHGVGLHFQSPWDKTDAVQDRLIAILSTIDSDVVLKNVFVEEADSFWGVRCVTMSDGEIDEDIWVEEMPEELEALFERLNEFSDENNDEGVNAIHDEISEFRSRAVAVLAANFEIQEFIGDRIEVDPRAGVTPHSI